MVLLGPAVARDDLEGPLRRDAVDRRLLTDNYRRVELTALQASDRRIPRWKCKQVDLDVGVGSFQDPLHQKRIGPALDVRQGSDANDDGLRWFTDLRVDFFRRPRSSRDSEREQCCSNSTD